MQDVDQLNILLVTGGLQFALGGVGVAARRSFLMSVVSSGVMLQGVMLALVGASVFHGTWAGQVAALVIPVVFLTQVVVAIAVAWEFRQDAGVIDETESGGSDG